MLSAAGWWEWLQGYGICPLQGLRRSVWGTPREPEKENEVTSCPVLSTDMSVHEDSWQSSPLSPRISRHLHPGIVAKDTVNSLGESTKPHPQCLTLPPTSCMERSLVLSKAAAREPWNRMAGKRIAKSGDLGLGIGSLTSWLPGSGQAT